MSSFPLVVITTISHRDKMLRSLLQYLSDKCCDVIVVGDFVCSPSEFPGVQFIYADHSVGLWDRFSLVKPYLRKSRYVMWLPDDDFVTPRYLATASLLLDSSPDVSVVEGIPCTFSESQNTRFRFRYCGWSSFVRLIRSVLGLTNVTPVYRSFTPGTLCHSLFRSEIFLEIVCFFEKNKAFQNIYCSDRLFAFFGFARGRVVFIPTIGLVRSDFGSTSRDPAFMNLDVPTWRQVAEQSIAVLTTAVDSKDSKWTKTFIDLSDRSILYRGKRLSGILDIIGEGFIGIVIRLENHRWRCLDSIKAHVAQRSM